MSITIAVVEDNPLIAELLAEALNDEGYAVRVFGDGRSALEAIIAQPPTLALLDLNLPSMSGEHVLRHIRQQFGSDLPVVIMSAACSDTPGCSKMRQCSSHSLLTCLSS